MAAGEEVRCDGLGAEDTSGLSVDNPPDDLVFPDLGHRLNAVAAVLKEQPSFWRTLKSVRTPLGGSLARCIKAAVDVPGAEQKTLALLPADGDCYDAFRDFFLAVLQRYHGSWPRPELATSLSSSAGSGRGAAPRSVLQRFVTSSRVFLSRNLCGHRFLPSMSSEDRIKVEELVTKACFKMDGEQDGRRGSYLPLRGSSSYSPKPGGMSKKEAAALEKEQILFDAPCDEVFCTSGAARHWPQGRGVYKCLDTNSFVWVNEREHIRFGVVKKQEESLDVDTMMESVESLMKSFLASFSEGQVEPQAVFGKDDTFGYLSTCMENLGTGVMLEFTLTLPNLASVVSSDVEWQAYCDSFEQRGRIFLRRGRDPQEFVLSIAPGMADSREHTATIVNYFVSRLVAQDLTEETSYLDADVTIDTTEPSNLETSKANLEDSRPNTAQSVWTFQDSVVSHHSAVAMDLIGDLMDGSLEQHSAQEVANATASASAPAPEATPAAPPAPEVTPEAAIGGETGEEEDSVEALRQKAFTTFTTAVAEGRLTKAVDEAFGEGSPSKPPRDLEELRKVAMTTLVASAESGRLAEAVAKYTTSEAKQEEEKEIDVVPRASLETEEDLDLLRALAADTLMESLKAGALESMLGELGGCQEATAHDEAILEGAAEANIGQDLEIEAIREAVRESLEASYGSGQLGAMVQQAREETRAEDKVAIGVEDLKARAKEALLESFEKGIMEQAIAEAELEHAKELESKKLDALKDTVIQSLEEPGPTANVPDLLATTAMGELVARGLTPEPTVEDGNLVRERVRCAFLEGLLDGRLDAALQEMKEKPTPAKAPTPEIEDVRQKAASALQECYETGVLEQILQDNASLAPVQEQDAVAQAKSVLCEGALSGRLEEVLEDMLQQEKQQTPVEDEITKLRKQAFQVLLEGSADGRLAAALQETSAAVEAALEAANDEVMMEIEQQAAKEVEEVVCEEKVKEEEAERKEEAEKEQQQQQQQQQEEEEEEEEEEGAVASSEQPPTEEVSYAFPTRAAAAPAPTLTKQSSFSGKTSTSTLKQLLDAVSARDRRIGELTARIRDTEQQIVHQDSAYLQLSELMTAAQQDLAHVDLDMEWHKQALEGADARFEELQKSQLRLENDLEGQPLAGLADSTGLMLYTARSDASTSVPSTFSGLTPRPPAGKCLQPIRRPLPKSTS